MAAWMRLLTCWILIGFFISGESASVKDEEVAREEGSSCPVNLPQKSTKRCKVLRETELAAQKAIYQLTIKPPLPMPLVNMTIKQLAAHHSQDEFFKEHFTNYFGMLMKTRRLGAQWIAEHTEEITEFQGYENIYHEFRRNMLTGSDFFRFVSDSEPFQDFLKDWRDDNIFTDLRLCGINPMVLRRVTDDASDVGLKWSELSKVLNPNYNWEAAIQAIMNEPLDKAVKDGYVYVLRYEVFDDLISFPDVADTRPDRSLWPTTSPIALFAVKDKRLRPVAIQIDYKPDSPVFSPSDGGSWMLAKSVVQATDYAHSQMIEHLLKIHLFSEPFCVVLHRQLSSNHPLNVLLKYSCRGVLAANTLGAPQLISPGTFMDKLSAFGYKGTIMLVGRGYEEMSWKDADFRLDMKKRGVDDKKLLPYFPFRDDSELLFRAIKKMAKEYVGIYYRRNRDVKKDKELQAFVNELSAKGTGPDGGNGQVKDFPAVMKTKKEVVDMVTHLLWLMSVKHAAVDYPMGEYGAFTPLSPTKVYNDSRVPPETFAVFNLAHVNISVAQMQVAMNVGTYHYDTLFDQYDELTDSRASEVVKKYYNYLKDTIDPMLKKRNNRRFHEGHLTYPYLEHYWLPNGIQT
ncbi:allene oxide synthase-lipoxygenase protein-like [Oculina patagonica]